LNVPERDIMHYIERYFIATYFLFKTVCFFVNSWMLHWSSRLHLQFKECSLCHSTWNVEFTRMEKLFGLFSYICSLHIPNAVG